MNISEVINKIEKKLENILNETFDKKNLCDKSNYVSEYNLDSLTFVKLLVEIENEFGIIIDLEEIEYSQLCIYGSLTKYVLDKVEEKGKNMF